MYLKLRDGLLLIMSYRITTLCVGSKYDPIKPHWLDRINKRCTKVQEVHIFDNSNIQKSEIPAFEYAWWDVVRLRKNILLSLEKGVPIVHVDMDIVIETDLEEIVKLPYDFIISTEIGGDRSYPAECSKKLGFGVCSGFYVIKKGGLPFMTNILKNMSSKKYNSLSDQVNIMNYIVNNTYKVKEETCSLNGADFKNKIIEIDGIKICVLHLLTFKTPIL
jgi:hypothetical protein